MEYIEMQERLMTYTSEELLEAFLLKEDPNYTDIAQAILTCIKGKYAGLYQQATTQETKI